MAGVAVTIAGRTSLAGGEVDLLLLAGGQRWCAAIHLDTGALLSARWDDPVDGLAPLVVARALVSDDQSDVDPARPEEVALDTPPRPVAKANRRRAERLLRDVLHPTVDHLLGFPGPAIPYWTLDGTRPATTVVAPASAPVITNGVCRFRWRNLFHALPVLPQALVTRPRHPNRLVVTLSAPREGYCYKVVAALL